MNLQKKLPWYSVSLLLSLLGAVSIFLLFGVRFFNDYGVVFWVIILAWSFILLGSTTEISRLEKLRCDSIECKNKKIAELEKEIEKLKKGA